MIDISPIPGAKPLQRLFRASARLLGTSRGLYRVLKLLATVFPGLRRYGASLVDGSELLLDGRESMSFQIFLQGCIPHERSETEVLKHLTKPGDVFVDVGANVGFYTALARTWVGTEGKVIACEPNPACLALLRQSFASAPNVIMVPCAVGCENATREYARARSG